MPVLIRARGTRWVTRLTNCVLPLFASADVTNRIGECTAAVSCTHANMTHSATVSAWSSRHYDVPLDAPDEGKDQLTGVDGSGHGSTTQ